MNKFCIVGLGEHARKKIIPAIRNLKNVHIAAVTSSLDFRENDVLKFDTIDQAISKLDKDYIFYISTPPSTHYELAKKLLLNDFNCLIEKPIFLFAEEFESIKNIARTRSKYFFECFMHRYGNIYSEFIEIYQKEIDNIKSLDIKFCIPKIPSNTFRSIKNISSSLIYDIGCYPISLINDISENNEIKIVSIENYGNYSKEKFKITGKINQINLNINFGIDDNYENFVKINLKNKFCIKFEYFFYGRKAEKKIITNNDNLSKIRIINDGNLFEEMLKKVKTDIHKNQKLINVNIKRNILDLELLISQYTNFNNHAP